MRGGASGRAYIRSMYARRCGQSPSNLASLPQSSVSRHEIGDGRVISGEEPASLHVLFEHGGHFFEITTGKANVFGQSVFLGIERRMTRNAPERLFQLGRRE